MEDIEMDAFDDPIIDDPIIDDPIIETTFSSLPDVVTYTPGMVDGSHRSKYY